jgi:hypothetical protein
MSLRRSRRSSTLSGYFEVRIAIAFLYFTVPITVLGYSVGPAGLELCPAT